MLFGYNNHEFQGVMDLWGSPQDSALREPIID